MRESLVGLLHMLVILALILSGTYAVSRGYHGTAAFNFAILAWVFADDIRDAIKER